MLCLEQGFGMGKRGRACVRIWAYVCLALQTVEAIAPCALSYTIEIIPSAIVVMFFWTLFTLVLFTIDAEASRPGSCAYSICALMETSLPYAAFTPRSKFDCWRMRGLDCCICESWCLWLMRLQYVLEIARCVLSRCR